MHAILLSHIFAQCHASSHSPTATRWLLLQCKEREREIVRQCNVRERERHSEEGRRVVRDTEIAKQETVFEMLAAAGIVWLS